MNESGVVRYPGPVPATDKAVRTRSSEDRGCRPGKDRKTTILG